MRLFLIVFVVAFVVMLGAEAIGLVTFHSF